LESLSRELINFLSPSFAILFVAGIFVGCCGFPVGRRKYYGMFNVVELQDTFYNPPEPGKLARLRQEAPESFTFTMKAWQAITHPVDSPTWKRSRFKPGGELRDRYGYLRPTREVLEAWEQTASAARALQARVVVLQMPPSFTASEENVRNAESFFSTVESREFIIGWEVRGDWPRNLDKLARVLEKFDRVIHVVDPFRLAPAVERGTAYFRLHGIGPREVNYRYKYTDADLERLWEMAEPRSSRGEVYVMFNNVYMLQDASRFKEKYLRAV